jgi:glycerol-3-phosphate acyltransferase PlsY
MLAAAFPAGVICCLTWLAMAWLFRISSLAALTAAAFSPLFVFAVQERPIAKIYLAVFMAVLVFVRHHENIRRLLGGTEPKIGGGKASAA